MRTQRVVRALRPSAGLAVLALALIVLGLVLTGSATAASATPYPSVTPVVMGGETRGSIVQFGEDVMVPAGTRVEDVGAFGGDVTIDGTVTGSVVAFGGDVFVRGTVENEIAAFGGDVTLASTAVVGSTLSPQDTSIFLLGGTLTRDPGAQITGDVQRVDKVNWAPVLNWATQHTVIRPWWGFTLMGWIVQTAFFLVLALVAAALMPRQLRAVQRHLTFKPAGSLGWGALIFFIAGPAVLVVLVISIVGLLVVIPYVLLVLLAYFFVTTAVAALVAQRVLAGSRQNDNLMLAVTVGVIGTTIVSRIPVLGPLVAMAMIVFGTGAAALAIVEWRQRRKPAAAPALPGASEATFAGPAGGEAVAPLIPNGSVPPVVPPVVPPEVPPEVPPVVPPEVPPEVPPVVPVESATASASADQAPPVGEPPAQLEPPVDA